MPINKTLKSILLTLTSLSMLTNNDTPASVRNADLCLF